MTFSILLIYLHYLRKKSHFLTETMEEHRLIEMPKSWEPDFVRILKEVEPLKQKLVSQLDLTAMAYERSDIEQAFDIKILFVFQRYMRDGHPEGVVKAHILRALPTYRDRLNKTQKQVRFATRSHCLDDVRETDIPVAVKHQEKYNAEEKEKLEAVYHYMRHRLSADAFLVFDVDINPPLYIIERHKHKKAVNTPAPASLVAEFLEFNCANPTAYVSELRAEVRKAIVDAQKAIGS